MTANHQYVHKRLLLYLDQELSSKEHQRIQHHLDLCSTCQAMASSLASVYGQKAVEQPSLPPFLWTQVSNRIRQPRKVAVRGLFRPCLGIAMIVICVLIGHLLGSFPAAPDSAAVAVSEEQLIYESFDLNSTEPFAKISLAGAVHALYNGQ